MTVLVKQLQVASRPQQSNAARLSAPSSAVKLKSTPVIGICEGLGVAIMLQQKGADTA
jgi:hypothetical protein